MRKDELSDEYLEWMYEIVCDDRYSKTKYRKLFSYLYSVDFEYTIPMDGNRYEDGINLRYDFGKERGYSDCIIASSIDDKSCSVLEMMIALAVRVEVHIMDNPEFGNRVGQWFWEMIVSLGLGSMTDDRFDVEYADRVIDRFLNREYSKNGEGGLFTIKDKTRDMRSLEIWYQMCWHLNEISE